MSQTYFGSALRSGSGTLTDSVDGGYVVLEQTVTVTTAAAGTATSSSVTLPSGSQIIDLFLDTMVTPVVGGGTAQSANAFTVNGNGYVSGNHYVSTNQSVLGSSVVGGSSPQAANALTVTGNSYTSSNHYVAGVEYIPSEDQRYTAEVFYKKYSGVLKTHPPCV